MRQEAGIKDDEYLYDEITKQESKMTKIIVQLFPIESSFHPLVYETNGKNE